MPKSLSPRQVVEALMRGISDGAWKELHVWFADDAVVEYPFALPAPTRLEGQEAIQRYFAGIATSPLKLQMRDMIVHETLDPEVVVAQWDYDGQVTTTARTFRVSNITVTRVRNGKILASRDYHNHAVIARELGRLRATVLCKCSARNAALFAIVLRFGHSWQRWLELKPTMRGKLG